MAILSTHWDLTGTTIAPPAQGPSYLSAYGPNLGKPSPDTFFFIIDSLKSYAFNSSSFK